MEIHDTPRGVDHRQEIRSATFPPLIAGVDRPYPLCLRAPHVGHEGLGSNRRRASAAVLRHYAERGSTQETNLRRTASSGLGFVTLRKLAVGSPVSADNTGKVNGAATVSRSPPRHPHSRWLSQAVPSFGPPWQTRSGSSQLGSPSAGLLLHGSATQLHHSPVSSGSGQSQSA